MRKKITIFVEVVYYLKVFPLLLMNESNFMVLAIFVAVMLNYMSLIVFKNCLSIQLSELIIIHFS